MGTLSDELLKNIASRSAKWPAWAEEAVEILQERIGQRISNKETKVP